MIAIASNLKMTNYLLSEASNPNPNTVIYRCFSSCIFIPKDEVYCHYASKSGVASISQYVGE